MSIAEERQQAIIDEFSPFDEWMERYEHIIAIGSGVAPLAEKERVPENLIQGCQSKVWLVCEKDNEGKFRFRAESNTLIISGIVALLLRVFDGLTYEQVEETEIFFLREIGLASHLSETRANGIKAVIETIKSLRGRNG
ncbi:MAG: SufE family protein [Paludibacteraceae bacterium]|nr:SufE family protein [Paludibacteraceae bacterium]